ncbi:N,N-dimethylformamidase beta subunit family domain-containing protein [Sphingobium sp.]|uniref:N,N-dimethylformamidase beta subunit family domain-containing protein n=1 Tax=Sphingobium sp. TaxID=1912891 RepID=UPI0028BF4459|nr:N,N-dimethylformamidase beta subunit family domain-containing protein [Sphingobium sp.]
MTAFYADRLSARPGDTITLFGSTSSGPCRLTVERVGQARHAVLVLPDIRIGDHATPDEADTAGCGWPVAAGFDVGRDWPSGYYDLVLTDAAGAEWHHPLCVRPPAGKRTARALLVLATNTYHAYNYWGGRSAYCDVAGLMSGRKPIAEAMAGAIGVLSTQRPFSQPIVAGPADMPRLVNLRARGFEEQPWAGDPSWRLYASSTPYDGSAGYLNKWEHAFVAWAEAEGIALDYATDRDLDIDPNALDGYSAVLLVGHSEYWTGAERDALDAFVDAGGNLAIFSGNTGFWKVRFEDDGNRFVCHKWRGFEADPAAIADPALGTHLWSHKAFGRPEAALTGLSFIFGGYHRLGMCVSRGQGGYTIYDDRHWALAGTDLFYGDIMTGDLPLLGYENDGCRFIFGSDGLPKPVAALGVPETLEIIGIAPCAFGESPDSPYRPIIPPEKLDVIARDVFDGRVRPDDPGLLRGHAVMASFKRGQGEVFNGGTTEWAHALAARDPHVTRITQNVLRRFGVEE